MNQIKIEGVELHYRSVDELHRKVQEALGEVREKLAQIQTELTGLKTQEKALKRFLGIDNRLISASSAAVHTVGHSVQS